MIKIPFLNTRIETDLTVTLLLTPLWWFSGFIIFIYPAVVLITFLKVLMGCIQSGQSLKIPKVALSFVLFLIFYFLSIAINAPSLPAQRVFASLNNYLILIMGGLLMIVVYHVNIEIFLKQLFNAGKVLSVITGILGIFFLMSWYGGRHELNWPALLSLKIPSLLDYPYFYSLMMITGTDHDLFGEVEVPRLAIYSQAPTSTGGLMVLLIPLLMAYFAFSVKKRGAWQYPLFFGLSLFALGFSISRAAIYGFVGAVLFVEILSRGKKMLFFFSGLIFALFSSGAVSQAVDWLLNMRKSSTVGRSEIYAEAWRVVSQENIWMGMGARLREEFTMRAVGSHALYIEILFVTGIIGLSLFILFQALVMRNWYEQKSFLKNEAEKKIWKFLGMSLIGTNIWLLTDTVFGLPTIAYGYFLVTGGIFLFNHAVRHENHEFKFDF
jgi:hypothetical protein